MQVTYFFLIGSIQPLIIIWTQLTWTSNILQRAKSLKLKKETKAKAKFSRQKILYKKKSEHSFLSQWWRIIGQVVQKNNIVVIWFEEIETMRLCLIKLWHYVNNCNKSDLDKLEICNLPTNRPRSTHFFRNTYLLCERALLLN